jgi:hypothetical protein
MVDDDEDNGPSDILKEQVTLIALANLKKIDPQIFGVDTNDWNTFELENICRANDYEEIMDRWVSNMNRMREGTDKKVRDKIGILHQKLYKEDAKRAFNWLIKDSLPQCEIPAERLKTFFEQRWKSDEDLDKNVYELILTR